VSEERRERILFLCYLFSILPLKHTYSGTAWVKEEKGRNSEGEEGRVWRSGVKKKICGGIPLV